MKKFAALILSGVMAISAALPAFGAGDINVYVDGVKLFFDQPPVIKDDRTLVPMRIIFEALGAEVEWIASEKRVNVFWGKDSLDLWIGKTEMKTGGGKTITLDVPAQIINSRTMVPLRAVSEAMEAYVEWEPVGRNIFIQKYNGETVDSEIYDFSFVLPEGFYVDGHFINQGIDYFVLKNGTDEISIVVSLSEDLYDVKSYYDANIEYINSDPQLELLESSLTDRGYSMKYKETGKVMHSVFAKDSRNFECGVTVDYKKDAVSKYEYEAEKFLSQFYVED